MAKGLKKKYIKQAGGDFKKAWRLQKAKGKPSKSRSKKGVSSKPRRKKTMKKKIITNAYLRGAIIDLGGDIIGPRARIDSRLLKAGAAYYTKDKALAGAMATNYLKGGIPAVSEAIETAGEWL